MYKTIIFFICGLLLLPTLTAAAELHLALADSTCDAMKEAGDAFSKKSGIALRYTCKSSGLLAKGIQTGPIDADLYVSANKKWMDRVVDAGLIDRDAVKQPWANALVVASAAKKPPVALASLQDLAQPRVKNIIIGDPSRAPFGRYAKQALQNSGVWPQIRHKVITRKTISLAIQTEKEEAAGTVAIIFRTGMDSTLRHELSLPPSLSSSMNYHLGPLKKSATQKELAAFLSFLKGDLVKKIFTDRGFVIIQDFRF